MAIKAAFNLERYSISEFKFSQLKQNMASISLSFQPSGVYHEKEGKFNLKLQFNAFYEKDGKPDETDTLIEVVMDSVFAFTDSPKFNDIPAYFYQNSIAILFPYIRAFTTTLTAIANVSPFILPTMNLSTLEEPLKAHTKSV